MEKKGSLSITLQRVKQKGAVRISSFVHDIFFNLLESCLINKVYQ